jgi:hypothetical protein
MGLPAPTTKFTSLEVTLTETRRRAAIDAPYHSRQCARKLEGWLEMQHPRFVMREFNAYSYNVVVWVTSQFFGPMNIWWLNHKQHAPSPDTFDSLVTKIRKTCVLANNRRDEKINAMLGLTQEPLSYAT